MAYAADIMLGAQRKKNHQWKQRLFQEEMDDKNQK